MALWLGTKILLRRISSDIAAACMTKILADIYVAIKTGVTVTKRSGHYQPPHGIIDNAFQRHLLPRSLVVQTPSYCRSLCRRHSIYLQCYSKGFECGKQTFITAQNYVPQSKPNHATSKWRNLCHLLRTPRRLPVPKDSLPDWI